MQQQGQPPQQAASDLQELLKEIKELKAGLLQGDSVTHDNPTFEGPPWRSQGAIQGSSGMPLDIPTDELDESLEDMVARDSELQFILSPQAEAQVARAGRQFDPENSSPYCAAPSTSGVGRMVASEATPAGASAGFGTPAPSADFTLARPAGAGGPAQVTPLATRGAVPATVASPIATPVNAQDAAVVAATPASGGSSSAGQGKLTGITPQMATAARSKIGSRIARPGAMTAAAGVSAASARNSSTSSAGHPLSSPTPRSGSQTPHATPPHPSPTAAASAAGAYSHQSPAAAALSRLPQAGTPAAFRTVRPKVPAAAAIATGAAAAAGGRSTPRNTGRTAQSTGVPSPASSVQAARSSSGSGASTSSAPPFGAAAAATSARKRPLQGQPEAPSSTPARKLAVAGGAAAGATGHGPGLPHSATTSAAGGTMRQGRAAVHALPGTGSRVAGGSAHSTSFAMQAGSALTSPPISPQQARRPPLISAKAGPATAASSRHGMGRLEAAALPPVAVAVTSIAVAAAAAPAAYTELGCERSHASLTLPSLGGAPDMLAGESLEDMLAEDPWLAATTQADAEAAVAAVACGVGIGVVRSAAATPAVALTPLLQRRTSDELLQPLADAMAGGQGSNDWMDEDADAEMNLLLQGGSAVATPVHQPDVDTADLAAAAAAAAAAITSGTSAPALGGTPLTRSHGDILRATPSPHLRVSLPECTMNEILAAASLRPPLEPLGSTVCKVREMLGIEESASQQHTPEDLNSEEMWRNIATDADKICIAHGTWGSAGAIDIGPAMSTAAAVAAAVAMSPRDLSAPTSPAASPLAAAAAHDVPAAAGRTTDAPFPEPSASPMAFNPTAHAFATAAAGPTSPEHLQPIVERRSLTAAELAAAGGAMVCDSLDTDDGFLGDILAAEAAAAAAAVVTPGPPAAAPRASAAPNAMLPNDPRAPPVPAAKEEDDDNPSSPRRLMHQSSSASSFGFDAAVAFEAALISRQLAGGGAAAGVRANGGVGDAILESDEISSAAAPPQAAAASTPEAWEMPAAASTALDAKVPLPDLPAVASKPAVSPPDMAVVEADQDMPGMPGSIEAAKATFDHDGGSGDARGVLVAEGAVSEAGRAVDNEPADVPVAAGVAAMAAEAAASASAEDERPEADADMEVDMVGDAGGYGGDHAEEELASAMAAADALLAAEEALATAAATAMESLLSSPVGGEHAAAEAGTDDGNEADAVDGLLSLAAGVIATARSADPTTEDEDHGGQPGNMACEDSLLALFSQDEVVAAAPMDCAAERVWPRDAVAVASSAADVVPQEEGAPEEEVRMAIGLWGAAETATPAQEETEALADNVAKVLAAAVAVAASGALAAEALPTQGVDMDAQSAGAAGEANAADAPSDGGAGFVAAISPAGAATSPPAAGPLQAAAAESAAARDSPVAAASASSPLAGSLAAAAAFTPPAGRWGSPEAEPAATHATAAPEAVPSFDTDMEAAEAVAASADPCPAVYVSSPASAEAVPLNAASGSHAREARGASTEDALMGAQTAAAQEDAALSLALGLALTAPEEKEVKDEKPMLAASAPTPSAAAAVEQQQGGSGALAGGADDDGDDEADGPHGMAVAVVAHGAAEPRKGVAVGSTDACAEQEETMEVSEDAQPQLDAPVAAAAAAPTPAAVVESRDIPPMNTYGARAAAAEPDVPVEAHQQGLRLAEEGEEGEELRGEGADMQIDAVGAAAATPAASTSQPSSPTGAAAAVSAATTAPSGESQQGYNVHLADKSAAAAAEEGADTAAAVLPAFTAVMDDQISSGTPDEGAGEGAGVHASAKAPPAVVHSSAFIIPGAGAVAAGKDDAFADAVTTACSSAIHRAADTPASAMRLDGDELILGAIAGDADAAAAEAEDSEASPRDAASTDGVDDASAAAAVEAAVGGNFSFTRSEARASGGGDLDDHMYDAEEDGFEVGQHAAAAAGYDGAAADRVREEGEDPGMEEEPSPRQPEAHIAASASPTTAAAATNSASVSPALFASDACNLSLFKASAMEVETEEAAAVECCPATSAPGTPANTTVAAIAVPLPSAAIARPSLGGLSVVSSHRLDDIDHIMDSEEAQMEDIDADDSAGGDDEGDGEEAVPEELPHKAPAGAGAALLAAAAATGSTATAVTSGTEAGADIDAVDDAAPAMSRKRARLTSPGPVPEPMEARSGGAGSGPSSDSVTASGEGTPAGVTEEVEATTDAPVAEGPVVSADSVAPASEACANTRAGSVDAGGCGPAAQLATAGHDDAAAAVEQAAAPGPSVAFAAPDTAAAAAVVGLGLPQEATPPAIRPPHARSASAGLWQSPRPAAPGADGAEGEPPLLHAWQVLVPTSPSGEADGEADATAASRGSLAAKRSMRSMLSGSSRLSRVSSRRDEDDPEMAGSDDAGAAASPSAAAAAAASADAAAMGLDAPAGAAALSAHSKAEPVLPPAASSVDLAAAAAAAAGRAASPMRCSVDAISAVDSDDEHLIPAWKLVATTAGASDGAAGCAIAGAGVDGFSAAAARSSLGVRRSLRSMPLASTSSSRLKRSSSQTSLFAAATVSVIDGDFVEASPGGDMAAAAPQSSPGALAGALRLDAIRTSRSSTHAAGPVGAAATQAAAVALPAAAEYNGDEEKSLSPAWKVMAVQRSSPEDSPDAVAAARCVPLGAQPSFRSCRAGISRLRRASAPDASDFDFADTVSSGAERQGRDGAGEAAGVSRTTHDGGSDAAAAAARPLAAAVVSQSADGWARPALLRGGSEGRGGGGGVSPLSSSFRRSSDYDPSGDSPRRAGVSESGVAPGAAWVSRASSRRLSPDTFGSVPLPRRSAGGSDPKVDAMRPAWQVLPPLVVPGSPGGSADGSIAAAYAGGGSPSAPHSAFNTLASMRGSSRLSRMSSGIPEDLLAELRLQAQAAVGHLQGSPHGDDAGGGLADMNSSAEESGVHRRMPPGAPPAAGLAAAGDGAGGMVHAWKVLPLRVPAATVTGLVASDAGHAGCSGSVAPLPMPMARVGLGGLSVLASTRAGNQSSRLAVASGKAPAQQVGFKPALPSTRSPRADAVPEAREEEEEGDDEEAPPSAEPHEVVHVWKLVPQSPSGSAAGLLTVGSPGGGAAAAAAAASDSGAAAGAAPAPTLPRSQHALGSRTSLKSLEGSVHGSRLSRTSLAVEDYVDDSYSAEKPSADDDGEDDLDGGTVIAAAESHAAERLAPANAENQSAVAAIAAAAAATDAADAEEDVDSDRGPSKRSSAPAAIGGLPPNVLYAAAGSPSTGGRSPADRRSAPGCSSAHLEEENGAVPESPITHALNSRPSLRSSHSSNSSRLSRVSSARGGSATIGCLSEIREEDGEGVTPAQSGGGAPPAAAGAPAAAPQVRPGGSSSSPSPGGASSIVSLPQSSAAAVATAPKAFTSKCPLSPPGGGPGTSPVWPAGSGSRRLSRKASMVSDAGLDLIAEEGAPGANVATSPRVDDGARDDSGPLAPFERASSGRAPPPAPSAGAARIGSPPTPPAHGDTRSVSPLAASTGEALSSADASAEDDALMPAWKVLVPAAATAAGPAAADAHDAGVTGGGERASPPTPPGATRRPSLRLQRSGSSRLRLMTSSIEEQGAEALAPAAAAGAVLAAAGAAVVVATATAPAGEGSALHGGPQLQPAPSMGSTATAHDINVSLANTPRRRLEEGGGGDAAVQRDGAVPPHVGSGINLLSVPAQVRASTAAAAADVTAAADGIVPEKRAAAVPEEEDKEPGKPSGGQQQSVPSSPAAGAQAVSPAMEVAGARGAEEAASAPQSSELQAGLATAAKLTGAAKPQSQAAHRRKGLFSCLVCFSGSAASE